MGLVLLFIFGFGMAFVLQKTFRRAWVSVIVPVIPFLLFVLFDVFLVQDPAAGDGSKWQVAVIMGVPLLLFGAGCALLAVRRMESDTARE
ncbi:MAG: hypothetical protein FD165_2276 [Gammaproteobacteria bacterium]|nr:MAG: hypothetical protein FD165_2276 [Gammaproteobacteria bacterium]TND02648.1 MAG: hypothetical protein FD120_2109 [Gammaproteobacteria bacterium]